MATTLGNSSGSLCAQLCDHAITFVYKAEFVIKVSKIFNLIACELVLGMMFNPLSQNFPYTVHKMYYSHFTQHFCYI